jgi:phosphopantothenoylcysteine decarboxylase/phosphopantothenate--cysteine ligase
VLVTLGVGSSISAYKSLEILRELQKAGHTVRVAMTRNATRFIRPITFQSLSGSAVYLDEFKSKKGEILHIDVARETDLLLIAPATGNLIGKFANGIADDFITTLFLARRCPALIAPAMNVYMYRNAAVQRNIDRLQSEGVQFVDPGEGYLACGDEGPGRLAPVQEIVERALALLTTSSSLTGKHVVVTAGPTWEPLDPIRVLTNRSSGRMGYALAQEAAARGAVVTLITGPTQLLPPLNVKLIRVQTAEEMKIAVLKVFDSADYVIKTAAVSDFKPAEALSQKRKKSAGPESIRLKTTEDILQLLSRKKQNQVLVGFCAETENLEDSARQKLQAKNLDFIVANQIDQKMDPFQSELNEVILLDRLGNKDYFPLQTKRLLASKIWGLIIERTAEIQSAPVAVRG